MATIRDPETFSRFDAPFAVGDWEVRARSNEIRRGAKRVKLEPKVMQVLCFLASRPGAAVSREELEAQAWSGMVVTYDAVTSAIIKLRKALGDEARHPRYIETLSKSGYRLIADVHDEVLDLADPPAGRAEQSRWSIAFRILIPFVALVSIAVWLLPKGGEPTVSDGGGTAPAPLHTPGIAVLPFVNLGAVPEQNYFADGITEDLITDLSKLSSLWVVARNSAFAYRGGTEDERTIARELGADYVLKGSVQRSAERGSNLWAERYDRRIDDLFALQDEIAASILSAIEVEIAPSDRARLGRSHLASIEAYDAFLRGLDHYGRRSLQDTQMAIDHYRRAIAIDP
uniref:winged helix-turn-helix domain-containing protein n=1 Tax=Thiocapsa sp. TaxID=2024551 RepID=UPI0025F8CBD5